MRVMWSVGEKRISMYKQLPADVETEDQRLAREQKENRLLEAKGILFNALIEEVQKNPVPALKIRMAIIPEEIIKREKPIGKPIKNIKKKKGRPPLKRRK